MPRTFGKRRRDKITWVMWKGELVHCMRCDEVERIPVPAPLEAVTTWIDYFMIKHENCKEKQGETTGPFAGPPPVDQPSASPSDGLYTGADAVRAKIAEAKSTFQEEKKDVT